MPVKPAIRKTNSRRSTRTDNATGLFQPRPKMTAEDALNFEATSVKSETQVIEAIDARKAEGIYPDCTCEPYAAVFTFNRWKALGLSVRKGEKAIRVASFVPSKTKHEAQEAALPGEMTDAGRMIPKTLSLFCRCQCDAVSGNDTPATE